MVVRVHVLVLNLLAILGEDASRIGMDSGQSIISEMVSERDRRVSVGDCEKRTVTDVSIRREIEGNGIIGAYIKNKKVCLQEQNSNIL